MTQSNEKPLKKSRSSSTTRMMKNDSSNTNTTVKNCNSCLHNPPVRKSINDAPPICWECVSAMRHYEFPFPFWKPKYEDSTD